MKDKILMIVSDPFDRDVLQKVFADQYELIFYSNEIDAMDGCVMQHPQVVVFDMRFADHEHLKDFLLYREKKNCTMPLIVIVSENTLELERTARENRVFHYIIKPYDFKELSESIILAIRHNAKLSKHIWEGRGS